MRVKRGIASHKRHKKLLKSVAGYRMSKHRLIKVAREAALHAGQYAYSGRRRRKSDFRRLWIVRISEAVKAAGLSYSKFINKLKRANIALDRKVLADFIRYDPPVFQAILDKVKNI